MEIFSLKRQYRPYSALHFNNGPVQRFRGPGLFHSSSESTCRRDSELDGESVHVLTYLHCLDANQDYNQALQLAQAELLEGDHTLLELALLNMAICEARLGLRHYGEAIVSGLLAAKLARSLAEWDLLGRALVGVGSAYLGIRKFPEALENLYNCLAYLPYYNSFGQAEGTIWRRIGVAHARQGEVPQSISALQRARLWFSANGTEHDLFLCLHNMVVTWAEGCRQGLGVGFLPVCELLEAEKQIVRHHPQNSYYRAKHLQDRATCYVEQKRPARAIICALQAMELRKEDHRLAFHCHMILHRCMRVIGQPHRSLGFALAARAEALNGRYYELEFRAAREVSNLLRQEGPAVVDQLHEEYQAMGIDLWQVMPAPIGAPSVPRVNV